jgi:hypothetical protein
MGGEGGPTSKYCFNCGRPTHLTAEKEEAKEVGVGEEVEVKREEGKRINHF